MIHDDADTAASLRQPRRDRVRQSGKLLPAKPSFPVQHRGGLGRLRLPRGKNGKKGSIDIW